MIPNNGKLCDDCFKQTELGRYSKPHNNLEIHDQQKVVRGHIFGGYEERKYFCLACRAIFLHSTDKNDVGWFLLNINNVS